jgi:hypothetical protein
MPSGGLHPPCSKCGKGERLHNRTVCAKCKARQCTEYERTRPPRKQEYNRNSQLRSRYKMSVNDWTALLESQGGRCACCGTTDHGKQNWHVDHDHVCCPERGKSCGKCVRGLLCAACNQMLGNAGDSPDRLMAGVAYLMSRVNILKAVS